ncbi:Protein ANTAGONIST OF LIKE HETEROCHROMATIN PROTEIN 1 [Dissostichus eleginoides]|uniref:Protein ANTAGONIST OF LIKE HETEROCHROMATIN PROTEIN 1 n=1 Tax=Dissostichus eleginoides TaxID=100907 RepID=A0AAD9BB71_DISEL|nr:Protein ANTAGONIST OF LIKE HETEROCHROMATIN PROTEIN 1 [Dissostichus eleginoides]
MAMFDRRTAEDDERYRALRTAMICYGTRRSMHDSRVLGMSSLGSFVDRGGLLPHVTRNIGGHDVGYYILADSAYTLQRWLMKSFKDNGRLTPQQHVYNYKKSRARVVVENAFGRLKGRWRCLMKRNDCKMDKIRTQVAACCILHNLCEINGDEYREEWTALPETQLYGPAPAIGEAGGQETRTALMRHLNSV